MNHEKSTDLMRDLMQIEGEIGDDLAEVVDLVSEIESIERNISEIDKYRDHDKWKRATDKGRHQRDRLTELRKQIVHRQASRSIIKYRLDYKHYD